MQLLSTTTLVAQDISSPLLIATHTATANRLLYFHVYASSLAGNADYRVCITKQIGGAGTVYQSPTTTAAVASGVSTIWFPSLAVPVAIDDVVNVYLDGPGGDTSIAIKVEAWADMWLRPTTADRTLDISAGGEAGVDWANVGSPTTTVGLSGTTIKASTDTEAAIAAVDSDVWTYATRTLTSTAAATMAAVDGSTLAITARATYSATISGLTISATWEKIWFTLKSDISDADASSVVQILETNPTVVTDGLLYLNGAAGTAAQGSLTIDQAGGTVAIVIADEATDDLTSAEGLMYDIKQLVAGETTVLTSGIANITYTATAAVA